MFGSLSLTGNLIKKHLGGLGDKIAQTIANFDPETATEVDRDNLKEKLMSFSIKLSEANTRFEKEKSEFDALLASVNSDTELLNLLSEKLKNNEISEEKVNLFCDNLEKNKNKLAVEQEEADLAQQHYNELKGIVDDIAEKLKAFDSNAKKMIDRIEIAKARQDIEILKQENQAELDGSNDFSNSALSALGVKATALENKVDAMKMVADVTKNSNGNETIDELRDLGKAPAESALERLQRLKNG